MAVEEASISAITYFMPILAFFLVFVVVYLLLKKTDALGGSDGIILFISFIIASFFIVEASLVEFVRFSSSWFAVIIIGVFFLVTVVAFAPGKPLEIFNNNWFAWTLLGVVVASFIVSSAHIFNWVLNWETVSSWFHTDWFGMVLLVILAAVVSWRIKK